MTVDEAKKLVDTMAAARRVLHDATEVILGEMGYMGINDDAEIDAAEELYSGMQYWMEDWIEAQEELV